MDSKKIVVTGIAEFGEQKDYAKNTKIIVATGGEAMDAHDGYHSFTELYDHRITLYVALCKTLKTAWKEYIYKYELGDDNKDWPNPVWRSKKHSDGEAWDGWFILGIHKGKGEQITYHIPMSRWEDTNFADTLELAPEWDGHTPQDVLERLKNL